MRWNCSEQKAQEDLTNVKKCLKGEYKGDRVRLQTGAQGQDKRQWAQPEVLKALSEHQETIFYYNDDQSLEQVALSCEV